MDTCFHAEAALGAINVSFIGFPMWPLGLIIVFLWGYFTESRSGRPGCQPQH